MKARRAAACSPWRAAARTAAALALAVACAPASAQLRDRLLGSALVGAWCSPGDDGASCGAWDVFGEDGTLQLCGRADGASRSFEARATTQIRGRRLCYTVTEARGDFWLKVGDTYCTEVVAIGLDAHTWRDLDTGRTHRLLRRPIETVRCP